eukprot:TRINITY_DN3396_c0_g2_i1.p1 TRINITY_DN3396_c0_g2~~TRINITY_DN3396_c0_g2_i1.p1  ORF type:complete len:153 (-),score=39.43 TRINITY_DN3396_c0_g2_i1:107-565(-)
MAKKDQEILLQQLQQEDEQDVTKVIEDFQAKLQKGLDDDKTKFAYAIALIVSVDNTYRRRGVDILRALLSKDPLNRDYLYYLALGHYKLGEYAESRKFSEALLSVESNNRQAKALKDLAEEKLKKEGMIGLALVGSVAVAAAGLIIFALKKK